MTSEEYFTIEERPANGKYKKPFASGKNFDDLYGLLQKYNHALFLAEREYFKISKGRFPIPEMEEKYRVNGVYVGVSKFAYFDMILMVEKYHHILIDVEFALWVYPEEILNSNK